VASCLPPGVSLPTEIATAPAPVPKGNAKLAVALSQPIADHFQKNVFWGGLTYNAHPFCLEVADAVLELIGEGMVKTPPPEPVMRESGRARAPSPVGSRASQPRFSIVGCKDSRGRLAPYNRQSSGDGSSTGRCSMSTCSSAGGTTSHQSAAVHHRTRAGGPSRSDRALLVDRNLEVRRNNNRSPYRPRSINVSTPPDSSY
jgi:hypothetical protein